VGFSGTVVISQNPVTSWERYSETFGPARVQGLRLENRADGGYYRCRFRLLGDRVFLSEMLLRGLMRDVKATNNWGKPIWEGFVFEMVLETGGAEIRISLRELWNKIHLRYRLTGTTTTVRSTVMEDAESQARFNIKQYVLTGGELESVAVADQVAQAFLDLHKWPKPTPSRISIGGSRRSSAGGSYIDVEAHGYMDTLNWQVYNQTVLTGNQGVSAQVGDIIAAVGPFVASTEIETNPTLVTKVYDQDRFAGDLVKDLARLGDGSYRRFICYMTSGRKLVFAAATPPTLRI